MAITVYSKPSCVQCNLTKDLLDSRGVNYKTVDVSKDDKALKFVKGLGYMGAPVVVTEDDHWYGFRPDKIKALAAA